MKKRRVVLSWSSGKDSAWCLQRLRGMHDVEVVALLTTVNSVHDRVAMHAVRSELLRAQARAARVELWEALIPSPCSNEEYAASMTLAVARARAAGVTHMAFGDLFLEDVRRYREERLAGTGLEPLFPLWGEPTAQLARTMIDGGLRAVLTCVDPKQISAEFVGRDFDANLLRDLPASADPCGERGEFHSFCWSGPMFAHPVPVELGERLNRDGFEFIDLKPASASTPQHV